MRHEEAIRWIAQLIVNIDEGRTSVVKGSIIDDALRFLVDEEAVCNPVQTLDWMRRHVRKAQARRDWSALPKGFEAGAVARIYEDIRPHFARDDMPQRIAASKARTFTALLKAINA